MIDKKDKPSDSKDLDPKETTKHDVAPIQAELHGGKLQGKRAFDNASPEERLNVLLKRTNFPDHESVDILRDLLRKGELDDKQPLLALAQRMFTDGVENLLLSKDHEPDKLVLNCLIKFDPKSPIAVLAAEFGKHSNDADIQALALTLRANQVDSKEALREVNQALSTCGGHAVDSILHSLLTSPDETVQGIGRSALVNCDRVEANSAKKRFLRAA